MTVPRIVSALVLPLLIAAGCGTGSPSTSPTSGAFESVAGEIGPDGIVGLRTALEAFSLEFALLPGVQVPPGPRDDVPAAAGGAVRWLVGHWSELTPAQRAAAERWIGPVGSSGLPAGPATRAAAPAGVELMAYRGGSQNQALIDLAAGLVANARKYIAEHSGGLQVEVSDIQLATQLDSHQSPTTLAWAVPYAPSGCILHIAPLLQGTMTTDPKLAQSTITHEVFHCAQAQLMGPGYWGSVVEIGKAVNGARGSWLLEGSAEWVGESEVGGSRSSTGWWKQYLEEPGPAKSLFARSSDAIGFFAHLVDAGIDPWTRFRDMFAAGADNVAAFARSGATAPASLETWAAGYARQPDWGSGWDVAGPGLGPAPADRYMPKAFTIAPNQKPFTREVSAYTNLAVELDLQSDLTTFSLPLDGRLHMDKGQVSRASDLDGRTFCTRKGGDCTVPGCSTPVPPPFPGGKGYLAVSGGTTGGEVTVTGAQLSPGKCQPAPASPPPTAPQVSATPGNLSCALAPASLVSSTLGVTASGPKQTNLGPNDTACAYNPTPDLQVVVRLVTGVDAASFARQRAEGGQNGQTVMDVPGIGEEAFSVMGGSGGDFNLLAARRGSVEVIVTATAGVDAEKTLEQRIFAAIPRQ